MVLIFSGVGQRVLVKKILMKFWFSGIRLADLETITGVLIPAGGRLPPGFFIPYLALASHLG